MARADDAPGLDALVQMINAAGSTARAAGPIGVPAGYQAPQMAGPLRPDLMAGRPYVRQDAVRSQPYVDGDEWKPASLPPERIAGIQQQLAGAGLLAGQYRLGVWDPSTRSAYRDLLEYANGLGVDDGAALDQYASTQQGVVEPPRAPLVARVTHPDDLRNGLRKMLREKTGTGKVDESKLEAMIAAYQGEEVAAQQQTYDMADDPDGGRIVEPRSFESFADEHAQKTNPVGYDAHKFLDKFSAISSMLGGQ